MSRAADVRDYPPMLSLDSGGVLTQQGGRKDEKHDGNTIWKATVPGAYGLVLLHQHYHGRDSVGVVSRVNFIPSKGRHWVERHAMSLGLDTYSVHLVTSVDEKTHACRRLQATVVVDDRSDALAAQATGAWQSGSLELAVLFGRQNDMRKDDVDKKWEGLLARCSTHTEVMRRLFPSVSQATWEWLCDNGPPHKPHTEENREELKRRLVMEDPQPAEEKPRRRRRRRSNKDKEEKTEEKDTDPLAASAKDHARSEESPVPRERKAWKPVATEPAKAYPAVQLFPKARPAVPPQKVKEDDGDSSSLSSSSSSGKAEAKKDTAEAADKTEADNKNAKATPAKAAGAAETSSGASDGKKGKKKAKLDENFFRRFEEMEERITDLEDDNDRFHDERERSAASSSWQTWGYPYYYGGAWGYPAQAPAAPAGPVWQHHSPQSTWTDRKVARAQAHRRQGKSNMVRVTEVTACSTCGKGQPGAYCPGRQCRRCCVDMSCPQHH